MQLKIRGGVSIKRILLSLMSLSIVATSATSLIACKQKEQFDFSGNNQFAKTASTVIIAKINNFLQYSFVYTEKMWSLFLNIVIKITQSTPISKNQTNDQSMIQWKIKLVGKRWFWYDSG